MNNSLTNDGFNLNIDDKTKFVTHWVAFWKVGNNVVYSYCFENLKPPKERINYIRVKLSRNMKIVGGWCSTSMRPSQWQ